MRKPNPNASYLDVSPKASISQLECQIRGLDYEVGAFFDFKGSLIYAPQIGEASSIDISATDVKPLRGKGVTFTHNHPHGACLSDMDIIFAVQYDLASIRAVGSLDTTYVAERPKDGWPHLARVRKAGELAYDKAVTEMASSARIRALSDDEANRIWARLTYKFMNEEMRRIGIAIIAEKK